MLCVSFPTLGTRFPTIGVPKTVRSQVEFPTVWRDNVDDEGKLPAGEVIYLVDKDGNLLLDSSGAFLTVAR